MTAPSPEAPVLRADVIGPLTVLLSGAGSALILAIMVMITADILSRNLLNQPIPGAIELVGEAVVACVFLQLASTLREGRFTRAELIIDGIAHRWPRLREGMLGVYALAGAVVFIVLARATWPVFYEDWSGGHFSGVPGFLVFPVWPIRLIVLVGSMLTALQFLLFAAGHLRTAFGSRRSHGAG